MRPLEASASLTLVNVLLVKASHMVKNIFKGEGVKESVAVLQYNKSYFN